MADIRSELESLPDFRGMDGTGTAEIDASQAELGLSFAPDYRNYLESCSIASVNGHELTGICDFPRLNVQKVTIEERALQTAADASWYVIERVGIDGAVAWQDSKGQVFITTQACPTGAKVANSLLEYLSQ